MGLVVASLAISAATAYGQSRQASTQRKMQRENQRVQEVSESVSRNQQRRQQFRRERIRRAQLEQQAQTTGTGGSSGLLGAQSAIGALAGGTQAGERFGELSANIISANNQRAADAAFRSQVIGAVGGLAQTGVGAARGFSGGGNQGDVFDFDEGVDPFETGF